MIDQKNIWIAVALSISILLGFEFFVNGPRKEQDLARQQALQQEQARMEEAQRAASGGAEVRSAGDGVTPALPGNAGSGDAVAPSLSGSGASLDSMLPNVEQTREVALSLSTRIPISTPRLSGSVSLKGGRLDDLVLNDYGETPEDGSERIHLLSPVGAPEAYYSEFGWISADQSLNLPKTETVWSSNGRELSLERPLVLTWDNGEGLVFKRTYALDENYMFTVNQSVENNTGSPVQLFPFGRIIRHGQPETLGFFILHEGLVGVFNETLSEIDYDDLIDDGPQKFSSEGGWLGFADKYWLVTLVPGQSDQVDATFRHYLRGGTDRFQVDYLSRSDTGVTIPAGGRGETESHLFAGAKEVKVLQAYEEQLSIPRFEFAIDWGWLHFITRPFFWALDQINNVVGNFGIAILVLTVLIKLVFFPLANTSYKSMSRMKLLAPEMTKIRERFKDDRVAQQQEMMALYKREKVNPVSGCLPIIIQIPVFFALYKVLFVTIEMRHAPFFGWIQDLSAPDPTTMFNLFGLIPWDPPSLLMIGIWPLLMGFTMWFQQKLNPAPPDPIQAKVFMFLPIIFTFMLASFPAGLVIYWTWNNALSILQQWVIMKRMGVKV